MDHETETRLLERHTCFEHSFTKYQEDVERDERGRKTLSRVCINCGHSQTIVARAG